MSYQSAGSSMKAAVVEEIFSIVAVILNNEYHILMNACFCWKGVGEIGGNT